MHAHTRNHIDHHWSDCSDFSMVFDWIILVFLKKYVLTYFFSNVVNPPDICSIWITKRTTYSFIYCVGVSRSGWICRFFYTWFHCQVIQYWLLLFDWHFKYFIPQPFMDVVIWHVIITRRTIACLLKFWWSTGNICCWRVTNLKWFLSAFDDDFLVLLSETVSTQRITIDLHGRMLTVLVFFCRHILTCSLQPYCFKGQSMRFAEHCRNLCSLSASTELHCSLQYSHCGCSCDWSRWFFNRRR